MAWWLQGPSGKMMALVSARVRVVAAWLKSAEIQDSVGDDGIIVVVSHGAFLGMLIELIGIGAANGFKTGLAGPSMPNTATTLLTMKGDGWAQVGWIGNVEHLQGAAARLSGARL